MQKAKKYFLETYGCQMNDYDSGLVERFLGEAGLEATADKKAADILLINSCSVRQHAENRVFAILSQYKNLKAERPGIKIVLLGCMSARYKEELFSQFPHLDLAVGPDGYRKLPEMLEEPSEKRIVWLGQDEWEDYGDVIPVVKGVSAGVAISRGCDNFCSYCVVPYVRGRERSRPVESILHEIENLAEGGVKEIILLGQNVNSYNYGGCNFAQLMLKVNEASVIERIRFMTSHPKDISDNLLKVMSEGGKIAPHLHLPVQSGSNRILELMNRGYTGEQYLSKVEKARRMVPEISLTTDIIAGFPGETEEDFQMTLDLVEQVRFDDAFTYRYSSRAGTRASELADEVPEAVKIERLERLIYIVRKIGAENLRRTVGRKFTILIERPSKKDTKMVMGRTAQNRVAVVPNEGYHSGELVEMVVKKISGFTLLGEVKTAVEINN